MEGPDLGRERRLLFAQGRRFAFLFGNEQTPGGAGIFGKFTRQEIDFFQGLQEDGLLALRDLNRAVGDHVVGEFRVGKRFESARFR